MPLIADVRCHVLPPSRVQYLATWGGPPTIAPAVTDVRTTALMSTAGFWTTRHVWPPLSDAQSVPWQIFQPCCESAQLRSKREVVVLKSSADAVAASAPAT